ncbi:MAG: hypothetical protein ABSH52_11510 [Terriglobia bacterium]|jgi:hypothetical protein
MANHAARLMIHIDAGPEADGEEQARLAQRLRESLLERDVDAVEQVPSGATPEGAKGDAVTLATLAVTLGSSGAHRGHEGTTELAVSA